MNRREFLQVFGIAAATLILPGGLPHDELDEAPDDHRPYVRPPYGGPPYIDRIIAHGIGTDNLPGYMGLKRTDSVDQLFTYSMSTLGSHMQWAAAPGSEIYVPDGYPVTLWSSKNIKAYCAIRLPGQDRYLALETSGSVQGALI